MNRQEIVDYYQSQINQAETGLERVMLEEECKLKLELYDKGEDPFPKPKDSDYECEGCGS